MNKTTLLEIVAVVAIFGTDVSRARADELENAQAGVGYVPIVIRQEAAKDES